MFGYIKMDKDAPKVIREAFKKMYCLECRALDKHYGLLTRMFVSEDVAMMMLAAATPNYMGEIEKVPCVKKDKKLNSFIIDEFAKKFAAVNICFVEAELLDKIHDDNSFIARVVKLIYSRAFKKVAKDYPTMHKAVIDGYYMLSKEEDAGADMHHIGDVFSDFIYDISKNHLGITDEARLSYLTFLAKWLYFIDGIDDLTKDFKKHKYNPFIAYETSDNLINNHYYVIKHYVDYMYSGIKKLRPENPEIFTLNRLLDVSIPLRTYRVIKARS